MRWCIVVVLALASRARADDRSWTVRAAIGGELATDGRTSTTTARLSAGVAESFEPVRVLDGVNPRPTLGALLTLGIGELEDAPSAPMTTRALGYQDAGLLAEIGLRWGANEHVYNRLFVTVGPLLTHEQSIADRQIGGVFGMRVAAGVNIAGFLRETFLDRVARDGAWAYVCPQQAEVVWIGTAGSDRFGAAFSWGL